MTKYQKWHDSIISKAQARGWTKRTAQRYVETHHIIPRSLKGTNASENLVCLTAKEHYIVHLLLTKIYTGDERDKMIRAWMRLVFGKNLEYDFLSPRQFEKAREAYSQIQKQRLTGENNPFYGRTHTTEFKEYQRKNRLGKKASQTTREKQSEARRGEKNINYGKPRSDEVKAKLRATKTGKLLGEENPFYGRKHSEETRRIISEKAKARAMKKAMGL